MIVHFLILLFFSLIPIPEWFNFGRVEEGELVSAKFWLKNESKDTVTILSIRPSCGCTYALQASNLVNPGDSIAVDVQFNTKGYSGDVVQFVKVKYDGNSGGEIYLKLKGEVVKSTLSPDELMRYMIVLIDVRDKVQFEKEHLVGSVWVDKGKFTSSIKNLKIPKNTLVVLVTDREDDRRFLDSLKNLGYSNSYILRGGVSNWKNIMKETLVEGRKD